MKRRVQNAAKRVKLSRFRILAVLAAAVCLMAGAALPAFAADAGWQLNSGGEWVYYDESGEPLENAVTPDGYLTDLFGVWIPTDFDSLVGSYEIVSETLDGSPVEADDVDGVIHSVSLHLTMEQHIVLHHVWAYANGAVMRSSEDEFYPNMNGTFNACYYPVRRGNSLRWRDVSAYSNYTTLTDNGDGILTLSAEEDAGKRVTVLKKL